MHNRRATPINKRQPVLFQDRSSIRSSTRKHFTVAGAEPNAIRFAGPRSAEVRTLAAQWSISRGAQCAGCHWLCLAYLLPPNANPGRLLRCSPAGFDVGSDRGECDGRGDEHTVGIVRLTCIEQNEPKPGCAITLSPQPSRYPDNALAALPPGPSPAPFRGVLKPDRSRATKPDRS